MFFRNRMKDGSLSVEAAIVFPVFFISIIPFVFLLRMLMAQSLLESALQNAGMELATESYLLQRIGVFPEEKAATDYTVEGLESKRQEVAGTAETIESVFSLAQEKDDLQEMVLDISGAWYVKELLQQEFSDAELTALGIRDGWGGISPYESRFFYTEEGHGYLIHLILSIDFQSPVSFFTFPEAQIERTIHAFLGEEGNTDLGESHQEEDEEDIVYRIGAGIHYHQKSCYLINKTIHAISRETATTGGINACQRCQGGSGSVVYITEGGEHFHSADCDYLFPDISSLTLEKAKELGLTPCGLCFGGAGALFQ